MSAVRVFGTRYPNGTVWTAWCDSCDELVCHVWDKAEAKRLRRRHRHAR